MEKSRKECCVTGVGCCVTNCVHHSGDNHCCAPHINVQNESAENKAETFCGTFAPKNGCC